MTIRTVALTLEQANSFFADLRHTIALTECAFCIGIADPALRGVIAIGRVDADTAKMLHFCTDGVEGGYTMLYGSAWRAAKALGYKAMVL